MTMMATPPRLSALRRTAPPAPTTISEALRSLFMAVMEYYHARSRQDAPMPQHILVIVRALQDSRGNTEAMQAMTLMNAVQSLSAHEIAADPGISKALAKARAALVRAPMDVETRETERIWAV